VALLQSVLAAKTAFPAGDSAPQERVIGKDSPEQGWEKNLFW